VALGTTVPPPALMAAAVPPHPAVVVTTAPGVVAHWRDGVGGLLVLRGSEDVAPLHATGGPVVYVTSTGGRRRLIAVVGAGLHGLASSSSTRIPGLVALSDLEPVVTLRARPERPSGIAAAVRALDQRLSRQRRALDPAEGILGGLTVLAGLLALVTRSIPVARAAVLVGPAVAAAAVVLSAASVSAPSMALTLLAVLGIASATAGALVLRSGRQVAWGLTALLAVYLVVLVAKPTWPALAVIGPSPDRGGRFFGVANLPETIVLAMVAFAGATVPSAIPALAAVSLVALGWSRAGADGGGLVAVAAVLAMLILQRRHWGRRTVALAVGGAVSLALLLVGLDAATGGRSHVTRTVERGPGALLDSWGHRLKLGADGLAASPFSAGVFAVSLIALLVMVRLGPRFAAGDALLVGLAVSLLVNDTPSDVASAGAAAYSVLWAWARIAPGQAVRGAAPPQPSIRRPQATSA
jgi:hypothetical protein